MLINTFSSFFFILSRNYFQRFWKALEPLAPTIPIPIPIESLRFVFERAPKLLIDVGADVAQTQTSWLDGRSNSPHCPASGFVAHCPLATDHWPLAAFGHLPYAGVLFIYSALFFHCSVCANSTLAHWFIQQSTAGDPRDFSTRAWIESNWLESNSNSKLNWIAPWPRDADRGRPTRLSGVLFYSESRSDLPGMHIPHTSCTPYHIP